MKKTIAPTKSFLLLDRYTIRSENLRWDASERRFHVDVSTLYMRPGWPMPRRLEVVRPVGEPAFFNLAEGESTAAAWIYNPDPNCLAASATKGVVIWNT